MLRNSAVRGLKICGTNLRHISTAAQPITVAHGDGIGPEIMDSTLAVLKAAGANLKVCTPGCAFALHL
jgi:hypothetical protein